MFVGDIVVTKPSARVGLAVVFFESNQVRNDNTEFILRAKHGSEPEVVCPVLIGRRLWSVSFRTYIPYSIGSVSGKINLIDLFEGECDTELKMQLTLSWNEIRLRASEFSREWSNASYEKGETHSFYNEFFEVFGVRRRSVAIYEQQVKKLNNSKGFIDLFWPGVLLVEQKSTGRNLEEAYDQASEYFGALTEEQRPQFILVCDFQTFVLHDLEERRTTSFSLGQFPDHVELFGFIRGIQRRNYREQDPVNVQVAEQMGKLHDALEKSGYSGFDLELLLVRIVFCLFADNTGIFEPRDSFLQFLELRTSEDGSDLGSRLMELFQVLDTPEERRLEFRDEDLTQFPHINGDLFADVLRIPAFSASMRRTLLRACQFDWSKVSPAIFGALFQSVMDDEQRRAQGAHYTTEANILKVIQPLFLDDLHEELQKIVKGGLSRRRVALKRFQTKLAELTFFDPACGCGNFLIVAYREIREIELAVIQALREYGELAIPEVNVDQFFGIEIGEFPVRIASTAMWMMDHIMNTKISLMTGSSFIRIPLESAPHIVRADALEIDWKSVLSKRRCSFIFGNPPFGGSKMQTAKQREQVRLIASSDRAVGALDYVAAWFIRAGEYVQGTNARIGLVATNSITQGEQVGQLWPILFGRHKLEIAFAHRTFAWGSDVRGQARVHVVVIGLDLQKNARKEKRLFSYSGAEGVVGETTHSVLSPYLFDADRLANPMIVVKKASSPLNDMPEMVMGSKPIDGGQYILDESERKEFLRIEPKACELLRPYIGSEEFIKGTRRWILALHDVDPALLSKLPRVKERIAAVRSFRKASSTSSTRALARTPTLYHLNVLPDKPFLVVPGTSSERREYIPIGWVEPPTIPSNATYVVQNPSLAHFAFLTSAMHMTWLRHVGGRLESRYRYSIGLVYNTFPLPDGKIDNAKLVASAKSVLEARNLYPNASFEHLYDPNSMPHSLRKAHDELDSVVDRMYRRARFQSERDRIEFLFELYEAKISPKSSNVSA